MLASPPDTLTADSTLLMQWQKDPAFDYNRELMNADMSFVEWLGRQINNLLNEIFAGFVGSNYNTPLSIIILVLIIAGVIWFIYKKNPKLFMRNRKDKIKYELEEDTIYGVDFPERIAASLLHRNYREAVRLVYLQTLKEMNEQKKIEWQPYKTPTQYIYEARTPSFIQLTNHFLRIRYGNFEATEELFHTMQQLRISIIEEGGQP